MAKIKPKYSQTARKCIKTIQGECDKALDLLGSINNDLAGETAEPSDCAAAEALVATWEQAATDAQIALIAAFNVLTEVNLGLQAAYNVRNAICYPV